MQKMEKLVGYIVASIAFSWIGGYFGIIIHKALQKTPLLNTPSLEVFLIQAFLYFAFLGGIFGLYVAKFEKMSTSKTKVTVIRGVLVWLFVSIVVNFIYLLFGSAIGCLEMGEVDGLQGMMCDIVEVIW